MVVKAWVRRMSQGGGADGEESSGRRWPVGILRRSGARAARRVLHVKYHSVPPSPPPHALPVDIDDTVSCFCSSWRYQRRKSIPRVFNLCLETSGFIRRRTDPRTRPTTERHDRFIFNISFRDCHLTEGTGPRTVS